MVEFAWYWFQFHISISYPIGIITSWSNCRCSFPFLMVKETLPNCSQLTPGIGNNRRLKNMIMLLLKLMGSILGRSLAWNGGAWWPSTDKEVYPTSYTGRESMIMYVPSYLGYLATTDQTKLEERSASLHPYQVLHTFNSTSSNTTMYSTHYLEVV